MKIFLIITLIFNFFLLTNCSSNSTNPEPFDPLEVDIRMEVQILDSTYQIYSRPFTKIYFTTYKLDANGSKQNFDQSDTTSCPNGWGVKLLKYTINSEDEKIILGAACENYDGYNLRNIEIDYNEAERRIDTLRHASIIKTFAIYYK